MKTPNEWSTDVERALWVNGSSGPTASPGSRAAIFVVIDADPNIPDLANRLAMAAGPAARVICWPDDAQVVGVAQAGGRAPADVGSSLADVAAEPITAVLASARRPVLDALQPCLAGAPGVRLLEPITAPDGLRQRLVRHAPRLLLVDEPLLGELAPESIRAITVDAPDLRVLMLCDVLRDGLARQVLRNGFHGFLLTSGASDTCVKAIAAVHRGELWLPRALLQEVAAARQPAHGVAFLDAALKRLTVREAEIVGLLHEGLSNKEIALRLGVQEDTVKKHLQAVYGKLGVRRRAHLMLGRLPEGGGATPSSSVE